MVAIGGTEDLGAVCCDMTVVNQPEFVVQL